MFSPDSLHHAYFVSEIKGETRRACSLWMVRRAPYDGISTDVPFRFQGPAITFIGLRDRRACTRLPASP